MLGDNKLGVPPIGAMLKRRRKELSLTLKTLSELSGVSSPFISQAERNHTTPSIVTLTKLATALKVDLKYFMEVPHDDSIVHRGNDLSVINIDSPVTYFTMSSELENRQMDALLMLIPPGYEFPTDLREGEDFLYVLEGELVAKVGDVETVLCQGDSMHFDSRISHTARNDSNDIVQLLYVGTPSLFKAD